jgi:regulator of protease activity HflC (stomatin/prohibitin superfamily)
MPDGKTLTEMKGLDLVWGQVTGVIPDYIGQFKLDELLLPERGASPILSAEATQHLRDALNRLTQPFGYHVTNVQITRIELPAAIEEQRERNWQAERQSLANLMHAQAEAARIRAIEQARAEAQRDLILAIAEGLNRDPTRRFAEPLLLALTSTITTSLANPLVPPLLTPETLRSLEQLKALLEGQHET